MSVPITPDKLEQIFDATTLQRGRRYFQAGHVRHLSVEGEGTELLSIHAVVNGSRRTPYQCDILIEPAQSSVRSGCSCPMGAFCKHVAATLLEAYYQSESSRRGKGYEADDMAVRQWVHQLHNRTARANSTPASRLVYVLTPQGFGNQTVIRVYKASLSKVGTFGKMQPSGNWSSIALDEKRPPIPHAGRHHATDLATRP